MRSIHWLWFLLACAVCTGLCSSNSSAQIVSEKIEGHADTSFWALHDSGRIFAAVKSTGVVVEYDLDGAEVASYDVDPDPTEMIVKGDHLVVACEKTSSFNVIDLKANKLIGKVQLGGKGPYGLFCSKVDNGYVYGLSNSGSSWFEAEVFQIDIHQMKIRKRLKVQRWGQSHPIHVAMTPDGNWVIPDARGKTSPSGADLMRVDEEECKFTQIRDHHSSFGQIEAGPANRYWTLGNKLYPLDIKQSMRSFTGSPVAIHPTYDLVASFSESKLSFEKFSDAKKLKDLPATFVDAAENKSSPRRRSSRSTTFGGSDVLIGFAAKGTHAIAAAGRYCHIVDLNELGIPLSPVVLLDVTSSMESKVGQEIRIPLQLTNKKLNSKATFEIKQAPKGAKLEGNEFVWTPNARNIGYHPVKISAKVDDTIDSVTIDLSIESSKLELGFQVAGLHLDDDGKYAIAWGKKINKDSRGRGGFQQQSASDEVAILDLESQSIVVQKPLAAGVQSAVIQMPYAFVIPKSGNVLFRLDTQTLESRKRMFLKEKSIAIFPYVKEQIGVVSGDHNRVLNLIDPETLKAVGEVLIGYSHSYSNLTLFNEAGSGMIEFQSQLYNKDDGSVALFQRNPGIKSLASVAIRNMNPMRHSSSPVSAKLFGRRLASNRILSSTGAIVTQSNGKRFYAHPDYPVAFAIRQESKSNGRTYDRKSYLETISLVDGEVLDSRVFDVESTRSTVSPSYYGSPQTFFPFADKIVYLQSNKLFVIPIDPAVLKAAPMPLHFPVPKVPLLGIDKPQVIPVKAKGGTGELDYQLVTEYEGIRIDSATGSVTIDTPALWKKHLATYRGTSSSASRSGIRRSSNTKMLTTKQIEEMLGGPLPKGKLPFMVPVQVAVTDDEAQEDRMTFYAVVLGDQSEMDQLVARQKTLRAAANMANDIARAAQRAEAMRQQKAREQKMLAEKKAIEQKQQEGSSQRIDELEKRVRRMEATLDAILGKLEKMEANQRK